MSKLNLAIDAARNDDMERVIKLLEEALAEQAEQEPVAYMFEGVLFLRREATHYIKDHSIPLYAAPVRTKDLTDDEINNVMEPNMSLFDFARAVIAKFKEKNRG